MHARLVVTAAGCRVDQHGAAAFRVPQQATDAMTLQLYNEVNGSNLTALNQQVLTVR